MAIARAHKPRPAKDVAPTKRLFTVHEYHKMGEIGLLTEDDRVELIEGEILVMPPIGEGHFGHVNQFTDAFYVFRRRAVIHVQNPIRLGLHTEPEPDITLLRYRDDFYRGKFPEPEDVLLLVEVADSSLGYDRNTKLPLYAKAGIADYWIVDLIHGELVVYREPSRGRYRRVQRLKHGDSVAPLAFPDDSLAVADLLGEPPSVPPS
jgi:Uma2 family endonuclease